jgi:hypothetical protein
LATGEAQVFHAGEMLPRIFIAAGAHFVTTGKYALFGSIHRLLVSAHKQILSFQTPAASAGFRRNCKFDAKK